MALLGPPFEAARGATVPEVLPASLYPVAQALSAASLQAAQLLGFALGGLLVTLRPGVWVLVLDALTFLASAAVLHRYVAWRPGADDAAALSARTWARDSTQGLRVVAGTPDLRMLLGLSTVVAAVTVLPESLAIAQADALGRTPLVAGLLCAVLPLGTVLGAAFAGRPGAPDDRLGLVRPLGLLACASSAACLLEPGLPGLLVLWFLAGVGAGGLLPANVAFVLRVDPAVRGRALSVAQVVLQVAQGLAVAGGGVLAGAVGPAAAVGWAGVLGLVGVGLMAVRWPVVMGGARPRRVEVDEVEPAPTGGPAGPRSPAVGRVRLLVLLVFAAAAVLWWLVGQDGSAQDGPLDVPWWALFPAVVAAQTGVVHFQVRRQAQGISLCHLPIAVGLLCTAPAAFVLTRTLGGAFAMAAVRGQRGVKLALNTAAYALEATVAVTVLALLQGWPTPAALYVAMAVSDLTSFTVVTVAIMVFERRIDAAAWWRPLSWLLPINVMATSFVLLAMAALWRSHGYLVLLAAVTGTFLASYRTFARLRGQHDELARLQDLALSLPALTPDGSELCDVVERTRSLLSAERAALWLADGTLVEVRDGGAPSRTTAMPQPSGAVRVSPRWRPPTWSRLVADVTYDEGRQAGVLLVQDRLGPVRPFDRDDRRLLEAVAALLGGGLDRGADRQRSLDAARRDPLTQLWTLPEASRQAGPVLGSAQGLLVVDVIGLQDVNDSLGHEAGDSVLVLTAQRLQASATKAGLTARIGGGDLLVVLPCGGPGPESVLRAVAGTVEVAGTQFALRVRGGFAPVAAEDESFEQLLRRAQAALARAAAAGTRYRSWTPDLAVDPSRRLQLAGDLQEALVRGDIAPVFQPLCRASDRSVVGAEALARWRHPQIGPVPPDEFIEIAEQTGMIGELTSAVLDAALQQARVWRDLGKPLRVSVNLSPRSLTDDDLASAVVSALERHGLPAEALLLEITESTLMGNVAEASAVLRELRGLGVHSALDDFGTGHSSLTQLRAIPVDEVKLDRSFLTGVLEDLAGRRVIATAVALCHDLGKTVVAEGVEDEATAGFLHSVGVDLLQGYHLGRPLPADQWHPAVLAAWDARGPVVPRQATGGLVPTTS